MEQGDAAVSRGLTGGLAWATLAVALLAVALRVAAFDPWAQFHADEFYQYLEQGHRLAAHYGAVPWEWRAGMRNSLIPQFLAGPFALGAAISPAGMLPVVLARASFAVLCAAALAGAWGIGAAQSRRHGLAALLIAAVWPDGVMFSVYVLSESLATALIACGAALLLAERRNGWQWPLAGLLLGLGALVRLQYAPFVGVLVLLSAGRDWRLWRALALGGLAALALGVASDLAGQQTPLRWIYANFAMNIGEGRAARFSTMGPLAYLQMLLAGLGPFAPLVLGLACFAPRRYRPLLAALVVNVVVHSVIGHKEYRFIWLSVFLILVLAAVASVSLLDRWLARRAPGRKAGLAMLIGLCCAWCGVSLAALASTGGAASARSGGVYAMAAHDLAARPQICGLAVPLQWHNHVISAYIRRPVTIYEVPEAVLAGNMALPAEIPLAANAMLSLNQPAPGYQAVTCHERNGEKACLWVRPGGCDAGKARAFERQAYMDANDL